MNWRQSIFVAAIAVLMVLGISGIFFIGLVAATWALVTAGCC